MSGGEASGSAAPGSGPTGDIRLATVNDLLEISAIYDASIPGAQSTADLTPPTPEQRIAWFAAHDPARRPVWVAVRDGGVLGWSALSDWHERAAYQATAELAVYVAPSAQGSGVGARLVEHVVGAAPALGVRTLLWVSFAHNEASIRLARRAGFARWGLLPRVTEMLGVRRDVEILGLELD